MPTYDYECRNCGTRVEVLHGVNAGGPTSCTGCGGPMRKLMSPPAIHFKGSGWAKKDRSARPSEAAKSGSEGVKAADAKGDDGKPADASGEPEKKPDAQSPQPSTAGASARSKSSTDKSASTGGSGTPD